MSLRIFIPLAVFTLLASVEAQQPEDSKAEAAFFRDEVVPLLTEHCLKCHSGEEPEAGLNLTSRDTILKGGTSGSAVDLETHGESLLLKAVNYDDLEMPPTGQLSPASVAILSRWVNSGLSWPTDVPKIDYKAPPGPPVVDDESRRFWSFRPVVRPVVPQLEGANIREIDAFIHSSLAATGIQPSVAAAPGELVRRMHYDLLGLPPDPAFVQMWTDRMQNGDGELDQSAIKDLIDHLLASPHYGEHWGRHWLDLVRYAETNSYERDGAKPHVWRYRDYVIQSFNDDKPYDQFVTEQLAGDELAEPTPDSIIATGFYRLGRWDDEPADPKLAFYDELDDIVTTTSQTFLGLTVNCARCHDHKIDPIPQRDYYRLSAFFQNIRRYGQRNEESVLEASVKQIDRAADPLTATAVLTRYENDIRDARKQLKEIEDLIQNDLQDVEKEEFQYEMNRVPIVEKRNGTVLNERQVKRYQKQSERLRDLMANKPTGMASALCVTEDVQNREPFHLLIRGNPHAAGEVVTPGFPSVLSPPEPVIPEVTEEAVSSGRRRILAQWITSPANPLTARVMVNRIWQYHFGRGIVRTSSDFGFQGTAPTHPELLDWLAVQFVESGWSFKAMHRLMMSSHTYQMSSRPNQKSNGVDPTNDLFWRFDMRRLSAEEIRDSILWATGSLNTQKMFGPSIFTSIPDAVKAGQSRPGAGWGQSSAEDEARRSVYIHVKRSLLDPLLEGFDFADVDQTCPVRFVTTQPTQALGLMNSDFSQKQAGTFLAFLKKQSPTGPADSVCLALTRVLQRQPTDAEVHKGLQLMESLRRDHQMNDDQALKYFCLVALNLNEFLYLD